MSTWIVLVAGLVFLLLAWAFLFHPSLMLRINAWGRRILFDDESLLARRQIGIFLLILSSFAFFYVFQSKPWVFFSRMNDHNTLLREAERAWKRGDFSLVESNCKQIVREDPRNIKAWQLLGSAWGEMEKWDESRLALRRVVHLGFQHLPRQQSKKKN